MLIKTPSHIPFSMINIGSSDSLANLEIVEYLFFNIAEDLKITLHHLPILIVNNNINFTR